MKTPILLITYKRPDTTQIVFDRIRAIKPQKLYVARNSPKDADDTMFCENVKKIVSTVDWECDFRLNLYDKHYPVGESICKAIDWFFDNEEYGIIVEDDCVLSLSFFKFCEDLLELYKNDNRIATICAPSMPYNNRNLQYSYSFSKYGHTWGWGTWKRVWQNYDYKMKLWPKFLNEGWMKMLYPDPWQRKHLENIYTKHFNKQSTWDYQFAFYSQSNGYLHIIPKVNLVSNIGFGDSSAHNKSKSTFHNRETDELTFPLIHPPFILADSIADDIRRADWTPKKPTLCKQVKTRVKKIIKILIKRK